MIKCSKICLIGFPKEEKRENEGQAILKNNVITESDLELINAKQTNKDMNHLIRKHDTSQTEYMFKNPNYERLYFYKDDCNSVLYSRYFSIV